MLTVRRLSCELILEAKYTVDVDIDTLSSYPVITPFLLTGESHKTASLSTEFAGMYIMICFTFPGTKGTKIYNLKAIYNNYILSSSDCTVSTSAGPPPTLV